MVHPYVYIYIIFIYVYAIAMGALENTVYDIININNMNNNMITSYNISIVMSVHWHYHLMQKHKNIRTNLS